MALHKLVQAQMRLVSGGQNDVVTAFSLNVDGAEVNFANTKGATWKQLRDKAWLIAAETPDLKAGAATLQTWLSTPFRRGGEKPRPPQTTPEHLKPVQTTPNRPKPPQITPNHPKPQQTGPKHPRAR